MQSEYLSEKKIAFCVAHIWNLPAYSEASDATNDRRAALM